MKIGTNFSTSCDFQKLDEIAQQREEKIIRHSSARQACRKLDNNKSRRAANKYCDISKYAVMVSYVVTAQAA